MVGKFFGGGIYLKPLRALLILILSGLATALFYHHLFNIPELGDCRTPLINLQIMSPFWLLGGGTNPLTAFIVLYFSLFTLFLIGGLALSQVSRRHGLALLLLFGLAYRLLALSADPLLDDDLHRYLWDGLVFSEGFDPYGAPPESPEFARLRDRLEFHRINFTAFRTIYPPLSQWFFALAHHFPSPFWGIKILAFFCELALSVAVFTLLVRLRGDPTDFYWYFCNPLVIKEWVNSAHLDSLPMFFLLLAIITRDQGKRWLPPFFLGLGGCAKFFPLLFAPLFYLATTPPGERWRIFNIGGFTLALLGGFLCPFLFFRGDPIGLAQGFLVFSKDWSFNPSLYELTKKLVELFNAVIPKASPEVINLITRALLFGFWMMGTGMMLVGRDRRGQSGDTKSMIHGLVIIILGLLLIAPTVNPWYIAWLAPFIPLVHGMGILFWQGGAVWSYGYYLLLEDIPLARGLEYLPLFLLLGLDFTAGRMGDGQRQSLGKFEGEGGGA